MAYVQGLARRRLLHVLLEHRYTAVTIIVVIPKRREDFSIFIFLRFVNGLC